MTPEIQNELELIRQALNAAEDTVLNQNAKRALEIVAKQLRPFGYEECYPIRACVWRRREEWVLELEGEINDTNFTVRHPQKGHIAPEDVAELDHPVEDDSPPHADEARQQTTLNAERNKAEAGPIFLVHCANEIRKALKHSEYPFIGVRGNRSNLEYAQQQLEKLGYRCSINCMNSVGTLRIQWDKDD